MLHFSIFVNNAPIGNVYIRRQHELIPGQASKYEVNVDYDGKTSRVTVYHHYDDGALVLIAKALEAVNETRAPRPTPTTPQEIRHVAATAFALTQPQRNAVVWLGNKQPNIRWIRKPTWAVLSRLGLVEADWTDGEQVWRLTGAGQELYEALLKRFNDRVAAAKEAGNEYWHLISP